MEDFMRKTRFFAAVLILFLGTGMAFGGGGAQSTSETGNLTIRIMNEVKNPEKVVARYKELTKNDSVMSKITPNFTWVTGGEYRDKLNLALVGREDYDLMFCGGWHGLNAFILDGNFADLTSYFNNDKYPGLKRAFPPSYVEAMTMYIRDPKTGQYKKGIFAVNLADSLEDTRGVIYREDLRKKYGLAPITDQKTLIDYMDKVVTAEKAAGRDWMGLNMYNLFRLDTPFYTGKQRGVFAQDSTNLFGDQTHIYIGLSSDNKTVLNAVVAGDSPAEFAKMHAGFRNDFITEYAVTRANNWNRFLSPARGTGDTELRDALVNYSPLSQYETNVKNYLEKEPNAEYAYYVLDDAQRNMQQGAVICDMVANNWLVVPEWSKNIESTMRFLDWMFGTRANHDLFTYGIQNEDWIAIGDTGYKPAVIDEAKKYVMPPYSFTNNPTYLRKSEFVTSNPDINRRYDYMYSMSTYKLSPFSGFVFDPSKVATEIASITALSNELQLTISRYDAAEATRRINDWHTKAASVGLERVRAELISQVQAFLNAKNSR